MTSIRSEKKEDHTSVYRLNELAFGRPHEADLVDALRSKVAEFISLVATVDDNVVGHILFTPVTVESEKGAFTAMGLAPMAVLPTLQNRGVGSMLIHEGLQECQRRGYDIVVVLGHPKYYPRFGFEPASSKGLRCEFDVPDEAFMLVELKPNALAGRKGLVKYHPEFLSV